MRILDTTFLIDLLLGDPATARIAGGKGELFTTQINMYEVIRGSFLKESPSELLHAKELFENIKVLQMDDNSIIKSAEIFADLAKAGKMIPDNDCITAGIALANGISKIVTRNKNHFDRIKEIKVETY